MPPNLKISPVAMIPHKSRMYRKILDLTFNLKLAGQKAPSVNNSTEKLAPQKSMANLGSSLKRIIDNMFQNYHPQYPFMFSLSNKEEMFQVKGHQEEEAQ